MVPTDLSEQTRKTLENFVNTLSFAQKQTVYKALQDVLMSTAVNNAIDTGDRVPEFSLPNVYGKKLQLASVLRRGPVVLSFYRGSWCPFCNWELDSLQKHLPEIRKAGANLIAVSPERTESSLRHVLELGLEFDVLTDRANVIAEKFGLLMTVPEILRPLFLEWGCTLPALSNEHRFRLPLPATYVIDTSGIVRTAYVENDYTRRMQPDDIIQALHALHPTGDPGISYLQ